VSAISLAELREDLVVLGEAPLALLGEDELSVDEDVVLRLRAFDGLGLGGRVRVDLGRETRGPAVISVSDGAVVDLDAHGGTVPPEPAG
jgi:hypothetical protein